AHEKVDDIQSRRFPYIINVPFVGYAEDMNPGTVQRLAVIVQSVLDLVHHKVRHLAIDISGQLDKARFNAGLFGFPGQIEGIDWYAVPAQPGAGVERHESEGLGSRGFDDLPDIDSHAIAHQGHLVNQSDVDHAEGIFEQLYHFRHGRGTDRHDRLER